MLYSRELFDIFVIIWKGCTKLLSGDQGQNPIESLSEFINTLREFACGGERQNPKFPWRAEPEPNQFLIRMNLKLWRKSSGVAQARISACAY